MLEAAQPLSPPSRHCLADLDMVSVGRGPANEVIRARAEGARQLKLRVKDPWMSGQHANLVQVSDRWVLEDTNSRNGSFLNGAKTKRVILADGDVIELGHTFFLFRERAPRNEEEPLDLDAAAFRAGIPGLATLLPALARDFRIIAKLAQSQVSIVLAGESGTGKEVLAKAIHALSGRKGPLIAVNCGAIPETLIESELFGYRKGAFSGATGDRPGLIRSADGGTLFLDEIGDLPLFSQVAFLRVLQEKQVTPVGGVKPISVDIRTCAATHCDLEQLVEEGKFRTDLFSRVSGFTLPLPPLRERREDLGLIIGTLLGRLAPQGEKVTFRPEAVRAFLHYDWPLNMRELERCLGTAVVLAGNDPLGPEHLPASVREAMAALATAPDGRRRPLSASEIAQKAELVALLREHRGNVSAVARALGKQRIQIHRWIRRHGLELSSFRDTPE
ncbi:MAG: sigma 54-interacting transcriptional regulator [Deltaproteobacteria bacterium]|nr:sigma 54-interacting transcriptional regulator [Deltaproteobacteria bacterium]